MTQINVENAMILNSKLIGSKKLLIDSKIFHFDLPITTNILGIENYQPKRILANSLMHMVNCCKEDLKMNPVFFSLININTLDKIFLDKFQENQSIPNEEIMSLKNNYEKSQDLIVKLLDKSISGLDFGKKFWNLSDL